MKLRDVLDLAFHPQAAAGSEELWHDPLIRRAVAALLHLYAPRYPLETDLGVLRALQLDPSFFAALQGSSIKALDAQVRDCYTVAIATTSRKQAFSLVSL